MNDTGRTILILLAAVVGVLVILPLLWGTAMMGGMMGGFGPGGMMGGWRLGSGWGGFGLVAMVAFWALLGGGAYLLVRALSGLGGTSEGRAKAADSPLDILKRRYASGEITREEFEQSKNDLST